MLKGRYDDTNIYVKIESSDNAIFKAELELLKGLEGKYDFKSKEWIFPKGKEEALRRNGLKIKTLDCSQKYHNSIVNRERVPFIRDYQVEPLKYALDHDGVMLLADDVGLGKTITSISYFMYTKINYPLLIITTASTKTQWEKEYERFNYANKKVVVIDGIKAVKGYDADVVIVNYDLLSYHINKEGTSKWNTKYTPSDELISLKNMNFRGLIIDECQRMKADTSLWTKAIRYLGEGVPCIFALSATPAENKPIELFNVLNLLRPDLFDSYEGFGMQFCDGKKAVRWTKIKGKPRKTEYWDYSGASNQELLFKLLRHHVLFRRSKHDAIPGLPKAVPVPLPLKISKTDKQEYEDILNGNIEITTQSGKKMSTDKVVRLGYLREFCGNLKLEYLTQFLLDFLSNDDSEKIVVFTEHHSIIDYLHKKFHKYSVVYDGRCTSKQKDEAKQKFIEDPACRIIFGNMESLSTGVDGMQTAASKMIITQIPYNPMLILQAIGRLERVGSKASTVTVYFPIIEDTVEEDILDMITSKSTSLFTILDGDGENSLDNIGMRITKMLEEKINKPIDKK